MIVIELNEEYEDLILDNLLSYSDNYAEFSDKLPELTGEELAKRLADEIETSTEGGTELPKINNYNVDDASNWNTPKSEGVKKTEEAIKKKTQPIKQPTTPTKKTVPKNVPTPMGNAELITTGLVGAGLLGLGGLYATSRIRKRRQKEKEGRK